MRHATWRGVMRRDLGPIITASAVAVLSCTLTALAIRYEWLGTDVGRGANFCEAARDWYVRQPRSVR